MYEFSIIIRVMLIYATVDHDLKNCVILYLLHRLHYYTAYLLCLLVGLIWSVLRQDRDIFVTTCWLCPLTIIIIIEIKTWPSQLQSSPKKKRKDFCRFYGIRTHGLCVRAALLYQLSYEDLCIESRAGYFAIAKVALYIFNNLEPLLFNGVIEQLCNT